MIFLIEYDRAVGKLISFVAFPDEHRTVAEDARLELELRLHRLQIAREVVLLEAADELALRRTHQRYFQSLSQLATTSGALLAREPSKDKYLEALELRIDTRR